MKDRNSGLTSPEPLLRSSHILREHETDFKETHSPDYPLSIP